MKKVGFLFLSLLLWVQSPIEAASSSIYWIDCWRSGIEFSKKRNEYPEALKAYTAAINNQESSQVSHFFLYLERGKLCLKMQEWEQAIQDFSFILSQQKASREEVMDALWGRGQAYLARGRKGEFEADRKRLEELEPFITPLEDNEGYLILKMGSHVARDMESQERLVNVLIMQKKIKSKQDLTFTPSGLVIVKKTNR